MSNFQVFTCQCFDADYLADHDNKSFELLQETRAVDKWIEDDDYNGEHLLIRIQIVILNKMKLPQNLNLVTIHELKQNQTTKETQAMNTLIKMGRQTFLVQQVLMD